MRRRFREMVRGSVVCGWLLLAGGCCCEGPPLTEIWVTPTRDWADPESRRCDWRSVEWNGRTTVEAGESIVVIYQDSDDEAYVRTAIEVYAGTTRLPLVEATAWDHACDMGCPSPRMLYRLDLPPGEYTLVHRARTGAGKPVNNVVEATWTEFEGERALVSTLVVVEAAAP